VVDAMSSIELLSGDVPVVLIATWESVETLNNNIIMIDPIDFIQIVVKINSNQLKGSLITTKVLNLWDLNDNIYHVER
jgi:hypothetical protein